MAAVIGSPVSLLLHRYLFYMLKKIRKKNAEVNTYILYRVQVTSPSATQIFMRKKSRFEQQVFQCAEKFTIEMRYIIHKMCYAGARNFLSVLYFPARKHGNNGHVHLPRNSGNPFPFFLLDATLVNV